MRTMIALLAALTCPAAFGGGWNRQPEMEVVVDGVSRAAYTHRGTTYIEALRGKEYSIRLTNPTPHRVAVALSVDGLNSIDAKHTTPFEASKWVLDPWETVEIEGWQVSDRAARRFYFTDEPDSYGARLGKTENLGIIAAVFFRERPPRHADTWSSGKTRGRAEAGAPAAPAQEGAVSEDYAATGMGDKTRHDVHRVHIDLDPDPIASMSVRYEFRKQLVDLGVFNPSPLLRRERAKGFEYCPE